MKISQNIYLENFKNKRFDNKIFKLFKDLIKKKKSGHLFFKQVI